MKKTLSVLLALSTLLTLAACGKTGTSDNPIITTVSPAENTTDPAPTQPPTTPTEETTVDPVYKYDENGNLIEVINVQGGTRQVYEYDDRGNVLEEVEYINGEEFCRWSYTYNEADQEILKVYYEYTKELMRWTYEYGEDGKLVEQVYYEDGQECWREIYTENGGTIQESHPQEYEDRREIYNENGDLIELIFYQDGVESYRSVFHYDEDGKLIEEIDYEYGVEIIRCQRIYNDKGEQIRIRYTLPIQQIHSAIETTFDKVRLEYSGGRLLREVRYEDGVLAGECGYDEQGNLTLEVFYENGKENYRNTHEYDDQGNRTVTTVTDNTGEVILRTENTYDKNGNLITSIRIDDHLENTVYTYDEQGNLLGWTCTANGQVFYTCEYRYVYDNDLLLQKDWLVDGVWISSEFYDETGRLIEEVSYSDGKETGSTDYYYYGNTVEKTSETAEAGILSQFSVYDNNGRLVSESHYQNNQICYHCTYNAQGRRSQTLYYQDDGTVSRHLTVYEVVEQDAPEAAAKAQRVTRVDFPALDNNPFSYLFEYEGNSLVREIFDGDDWVETVYDGSYSKPLSADWVDCYTDEKCHREYTYDDQGRLLQMLYVTDGSQLYRTVYTYDENGNLTSKTEYWGRQEMARSTYQYDSKGQLVEEVLFSEGEELFRYTYKYDKKGNRTEERTVSGETESLYTCQYDKNGNPALEIYTVDGAETSRYQYSYDKTGRLLETVYTAEGSRIVDTYEYDEKGNLTYVYSGDFPLEAHLYDQAGRLTETILYGGGSTEETAHYLYLYDDSGMLYEIVLTFGDHQPGSVRITYDVVDATAQEAQELQNILEDVLDWL